MYWYSLVGAMALLLSCTHAAPSSRSFEKRQDCKFDSATSPDCWDGKFDLSTNYYNDWPETGRVREYTFEIKNTTMAPDGFERSVLAINGQVPGPTIFADWGDTVVVHVINSLDSGTSIHFHGVRQYLTNDQDGVPSITQCPIAPGDSVSYKWKATQYGTSWYHSHSGVQAWNGVFGGIQINGPASAPYHEDLGIVMLSDWTHETAEFHHHQHATEGYTILDNGLINGKNVYNTGNGIKGERYEMVFTPEKAHRIRLVNTAVDTVFKVALDNHNMTVISTDFVSIKPFTTDVLTIAHGQRYDVVIEANQPKGDYWFRSAPAPGCSNHDTTQNTMAVVRYDANSKDEPTTSSPTMGSSCDDMPMESLVPSLDITVGGEADGHDIEWKQDLSSGWTRWDLNTAGSFFSDWRYPTLQQVFDGNDTYVPEQQVITIDKDTNWVYVYISNSGAGHPIHLHGHDFSILAQGTDSTTFDKSKTLKTVGAPRRDVAMLPQFGYLVIGFEADNPGVWLMHCHIGWHAEEGMDLQFVERADEIKSTIDTERMEGTCARWKEYQEKNGIDQRERHEPGP